MKFKYFVYDENGFEVFETKEKAVEFFKERVEICREYGNHGGEWDDDIEWCFMGRITHRTCLVGDNDCKGFALMVKDVETEEVIDDLFHFTGGES